MKFMTLAAVAVAMSLAGPASATTIDVSGTVSFVEASYMPQFFYFKTTTGGSGTDCPANGLREFSSTSAELVKAAYATILASFLLQRPAYIVFDTATVHSGHPTTCLVSFVGLGSL